MDNYHDIHQRYDHDNPDYDSFNFYQFNNIHNYDQYDCGYSSARRHCLDRSKNLQAW
jgi:hypothetical protein